METLKEYEKDGRDSSGGLLWHLWGYIPPASGHVHADITISIILQLLAGRGHSNQYSSTIFLGKKKKERNTDKDM